MKCSISPQFSVVTGLKFGLYCIIKLTLISAISILIYTVYSSISTLNLHTHFVFYVFLLFSCRGLSKSDWPKIGLFLVASYARRWENNRY